MGHSETGLGLVDSVYLCLRIWRSKVAAGYMLGQGLFIRASIGWKSWAAGTSLAG